MQIGQTQVGTELKSTASKQTQQGNEVVKTREKADTIGTVSEQDTVTISSEALKAYEDDSVSVLGNGSGTEPPKMDTQGNGSGTEPPKIDGTSGDEPPLEETDGNGSGTEPPTIG
ncbi:MAG: hypothetical protein ACK5M8_22000 [Shewanella algae]|uniref:hypothetical protein n=1 Tax=Shewanella algae TaxID=38313 RepID=UPI0011825D35|nr:hypothetical protein [Shewanella algae]TVK95345.1 hypothetical protein AYJ01_00735 [Shewanella algae]